jgi:hypothetical protein
MDSKPMDSKTTDSKTDKEIPENFRSVVKDFTNDLSLTFPEYVYLWEKWAGDDLTDEETIELFAYCTSFYPERFFDILYQNDEIFQKDSEVNTFFLPEVDFKILFNCPDVSEKTKQSIWKYLQLLLFTIVQKVDNKNMFGDTMNIFDGIDEEHLQEKLQETMSGISDFFSKMGMEGNGSGGEGEGEGKEFSANATENGENGEPRNFTPPDFTNMPNPENMHEHLRSLFDGKIGKLAKEMAEEITNDIGGIFGENGQNDINSVQDILKTLLKNPKKMMDLMKNVGDKLNRKMQSGDISQEELMKEASEIFSKMKAEGNGEDFNEMLKKMMKQMGGMGGMGGKNMRVDTNAMEQMFKKQANKETMRNKLLKKMEAKRQAQSLENIVLSAQHAQAQAQYLEKDVDEIMSDMNLAGNDTVETKPTNGGSGASKKKKKANKKK